MIKGKIVILHPDVKTLVWHATKPTVVVVRSCMSGPRIGDNSVTVSDGFMLHSQEPVALSLATNDDLYAISPGGCGLNVVATSP